jgi:hypothetical protein
MKPELYATVFSDSTDSTKPTNFGPEIEASHDSARFRAIVAGKEHHSKAFGREHLREALHALRSALRTIEQ